MLTLSKYSMGIGDRFGMQGKAQLSAFMEAEKLGVMVTPVWNKSNREHQIIHTLPGDVRREADAATDELGWKHPYHVDADHISLANVNGFLEASDFFTLDVADYTGKPAPEEGIREFVAKYRRYVGPLPVAGLSADADITTDRIEAIARKYLFAVQKAAQLYHHIEMAKGTGTFITEVSMDETDQPQTPVELFFILAALADEGVPAQTIAPKFTGRFNKGVDYVGDVGRFEAEFNDDLLVIAAAIKEFGLPSNLKLSVHSGSDKFSLYAPIHRALVRHQAGLHIKTAGTTWLEELAGLALAGAEGLAIAKDVYQGALSRYDEMCGPYASVIDINRAKLPSADVVMDWSAMDFAEALQHNQENHRFNPHVRQLLHVGYKIAAKMGDRYLALLKACEESVARNVTGNLYERHLRPLFLGNDH